uniref:Phosphodiesterase n=1 Tax=Plectus sambesii TaxID=2011161 RepID=A0A914V6H4_9BILA
MRDKAATRIPSAADGNHIAERQPDCWWWHGKSVVVGVELAGRAAGNQAPTTTSSGLLIGGSKTTVCVCRHLAIDRSGSAPAPRAIGQQRPPPTTFVCTPPANSIAASFECAAHVWSSAAVGRVATVAAATASSAVSAAPFTLLFVVGRRGAVATAALCCCSSGYAEQVAGMFPYVGAPAFSSRRGRHRWRWIGGVQDTAVAGWVELIFGAAVEEVEVGSMTDARLIGEATSSDRRPTAAAAAACASDDYEEVEKGTLATLSTVSLRNGRNKSERGRRARRPWLRTRQRTGSMTGRRFAPSIDSSSSRHRPLQALVDSRPPESALKIVLSRCHRWDFEIFMLNRLSCGHPVVALGVRLFEAYDFANVFQLKWTRVLHCLRLIESGYESGNQFHNALHAADVAQALHCFLQEAHISVALSPLEKLACILAAFGHDLLHPGVNQTFLEASNNFLCSLYHNVSVLENFHWRCLVSILKESRLLEHLSRNEWTELLYVIRLLVLATDMQRQQEYLNQFKTFLRRNSEPATAYSSEESLGEDEPPSNIRLMQILIKCADISNPCRPWRLSQEWSYRASTEFFSQGDEERRLGLPVTSFCDRTATSIPKIQSGFMEFVAKPLFMDWHRYMHSDLSAQLMRNLLFNCQQWTDLLETEVSQRSLHLRSDSFAYGRPLALSVEEGRSSLQEMADLELQPPIVLAQRRMSASVLLTTPYRRTSLTSLPCLERRRVSLPTRMTSSTVWTIETKEKVFHTESLDELLSPTISMRPPDQCISAAGLTLPTTTMRMGAAREPLAGLPEQGDYQQEEEEEEEEEDDEGRKFAGMRRHSEPVVHSLTSVRFHSLPETVDAEHRARLDELQRLLAFPRRRSLPMAERQLLRRTQMDKSCSGNSSASELCHMVEAS